MSTDLFIGDQRVFSSGEMERLVQRIARQAQGAWTDLGPPLLRSQADEYAYLFSNRAGVEVRVGLSEDPDGLVRIELELSPTRPHLALPLFGQMLQRLGNRWRWLPGTPGDSLSFRLVADLDSQHVGLLGETLLQGDIAELRRFCDALHPLQTALYDSAALRQTYKAFDTVLAPVLPWVGPGIEIPAELADWAAGIHELLMAGFPVGITGDTPVERQVALAALAERCLRENSSMARLALTGIDPPKLLRLAKEAPGYIAAPARALEMNTNPYERSDAVRNLLRSLGDEHTPCIFEGGYGELQTLFHGGQGADNDPLNPAVRRIPELPLDTLARFALWQGAHQFDLPLPTDMASAAAALCDIFAGRPASAKRLFPAVAERYLKDGGAEADMASFAARLADNTETFGAIGNRPRQCRNAETQQRFQTRLVSRSFIKYLKEHLYGQDAALEDYVQRLRDEVLARPLHQPLAVALQGTPGTGKSECLALTAKYLDIPHVVIDVASIPDTYTGMAQLLGSGRGIVGSHQSGRLEQVAKLHLGAVVEIADIDHATPSVRSSLGDIFLQVLQNGEAQSSIGSMFSCAGLLLGFSLNLPGGKDADAYKRVGFGGAPTMADVRRDVQKEIKNMISGAFLSRLGEPVLFEPLSEAASAAIVETALKDAALTGLGRLGFGGMGVEVEEGVAGELSRRFDSSVMTFGARGLVDMARKRVVKALLNWQDGAPAATSVLLRLTLDAGGELVMTEDQKTVLQTSVSYT